MKRSFIKRGFVKASLFAGIIFICAIIFTYLTFPPWFKAKTEGKVITIKKDVMLRHTRSGCYTVDVFWIVLKGNSKKYYSTNTECIQNYGIGNIINHHASIRYGKDFFNDNYEINEFTIEENRIYPYNYSVFYISLIICIVAGIAGIWGQIIDYKIFLRATQNTNIKKM
jgi:hypothetical protein